MAWLFFLKNPGKIFCFNIQQLRPCRTKLLNVETKNLPRTETKDIVSLCQHYFFCTLRTLADIRTEDAKYHGSNLNYKLDKRSLVAEEQSVYYIDLSLCTSRETEVNMLKKEPALEFTADGSSKKHPEASADTTGELRVRLCMQRRALAFQIANIASFVTLDTFISKLFALLTKKPIAGYRNVSLSQIVAADQALWQKIAQETRGLILTSGDPKPVDKAVLEFMDSAEVTYHLLPVRDGPKPNPDKPPKPPKPPKKPNPRNPAQGDGDRPPKVAKVDIPSDCATKDESNQNICFAFNRKTCPVRGPKCRRGVHLLAKRLLRETCIPGLP